MKVRFWGTRGSIATPGPHTAIHGGNTSCVEVRTSDGTLIVLDCGTGIRELGVHLLRTAPKPLRVHLFVGHTHWDHIQGFPFFAPAFVPGTEVNIFAPFGFWRSLEEALAGQMQYSYFPVKLNELPSRIHFTELEEGFFRVGEVLVETQYLNHTAPTIAYRMSADGATVAYVTDHEPFWQPAGNQFQHPGDQRHIAFLRGADLVIHDAQYSCDEYKTKLGWGHSTIDYATDVALAAGVARLALFHHDPTHSDDTVGSLEEGARLRIAEAGGSLEVFAAREGMELDVSGRNAAASMAKVSALRRREIAGGRVMVISPDDAEIATVERVLAEDGLVVSAFADQSSALRAARAGAPDLAIINMQLPEGSGLDASTLLRRELDGRNLPVLVLINSKDPNSPVSHDDPSTDFLATPFSPPMLRSRVRSWLARTLTDDGVAIHPATHEAKPVRVDTPAVETPRGQYTDILASTHMFAHLSADQLSPLAIDAVEHHFQPGQIMLRQGEPGDCVLVILSGRVRVVESANDSPVELFLSELGPGEIVGELGILKEWPRSATVVAMEPTRCLTIPATSFNGALTQSPNLAMALLRVLAGRLYEADRMLARYAPDPLTGLPGRRAFHDVYRRLAAGAKRRNRGVLLMVFDILRLRDINDRHGYNTGDEVLRSLADTLIEGSRSTDLVSRYGGDEFALLLVETESNGTPLVLQRVHEKFVEILKRRGLPQAIQLSVGGSFSPVPPDNVDELLRNADHDMQNKKLRERAS